MSIKTNTNCITNNIINASAQQRRESTHHTGIRCMTGSDCHDRHGTPSRAGLAALSATGPMGRPYITLRWKGKGRDFILTGGGVLVKCNVAQAMLPKMVFDTIDKPEMARM